MKYSLIAMLSALLIYSMYFNVKLSECCRDDRFASQAITAQGVFNTIIQMIPLD